MKDGQREAAKATGDYRVISPNQKYLSASTGDHHQSQQPVQQPQRHSLTASQALSASRLGHKHLIPPSSDLARAVMMGNTTSNNNNNNNINNKHSPEQHQKTKESQSHQQAQQQPMSNLSALLEGGSPTAAAAASVTETKPCTACAVEEHQAQAQILNATTLSSSSTSSKHDEADLASGPAPQPPFVLGRSAPTIITRQRRYSANATTIGTPPISLLMGNGRLRHSCNNTPHSSSVPRRYDMSFCDIKRGAVLAWCLVECISSVFFLLCDCSHLFFLHDSVVPCSQPHQLPALQVSL